MLVLWHLFGPSWLLTQGIFDAVLLLQKAEFDLELQFWWLLFETLFFQALFGFASSVCGHFLLLSLTSRFRMDHFVILNDGIIYGWPLTPGNARFQVCFLNFSAFWSYWYLRIIVGCLLDLILILKSTYINGLPYRGEFQNFLVETGSLRISKNKLHIIRFLYTTIIGITKLGHVRFIINIALKFEVATIVDVNVPSWASLHFLISICYYLGLIPIKFPSFQSLHGRVFRHIRCLKKHLERILSRTSLLDFRGV